MNNICYDCLDDYVIVHHVSVAFMSHIAIVELIVAIVAVIKCRRSM